MTRWLDSYSTFGHLHERKFVQWYRKFAKAVPKFCQITAQKLTEMSPNLATLSGKAENKLKRGPFQKDIATFVTLFYFIRYVVDLVTD